MYSMNLYQIDNGIFQRTKDFFKFIETKKDPK